MASLVDGAGVVVTGAGGGIGAAIARRLAAGGARVVVNDLNAEAAEAVAQEVGGVAVPGDAAAEDAVKELIAKARESLGEIDIFCANAGILAGEGPDAPEEVWQRIWEVNVMSHVRASRELLPRWLERGRGRFVSTASAAGLLTTLGSATYSVTKHAVESYAEWLSITYGDRGIDVHCICPQGVRTQMLANAGEDTLGKVLAHGAIEPAGVAEALWEGMHDGRFLILPHPEVADYFAFRATNTDKWLGAMRKLQRNLESGGS